MAFPDSSRIVVIGAGLHGLSTALHLAEALAALGKGSGKDVIDIDNVGIVAGATGIARRVGRNNYFQPALRGLMDHSGEVGWCEPHACCFTPGWSLQLQTKRT